MTVTSTATAVTEAGIVVGAPVTGVVTLSPAIFRWVTESVAMVLVPAVTPLLVRVSRMRVGVTAWWYPAGV